MIFLVNYKIYLDWVLGEIIIAENIASNNIILQIINNAAPYTYKVNPILSICNKLVIKVSWLSIFSIVLIELSDNT